MSTPHDDWFHQIRKLVHDLFPDPASLQLTVSPQQHRQALDRLQTGLPHEQFFCVIDLLTYDLATAAGFEAMGWPNRLSLRDYMGLFPETGSFQMIALMAKQTVELSLQTFCSFLTPKFVVLLPMRHANGKLMLVKRTLSPWQTTADGHVTAYLNEFVFLKEYEGEAMHPRFVGIPPHLEASFYQTIRQNFANLSTRRNPFAPKELDLLRLYVGHPGLTLKEIADKAQVTELTLKDYNKAILKKARELVGKEATFRTARDVAEHLHKSKFILES